MSTSKRIQGSAEVNYAEIVFTGMGLVLWFVVLLILPVGALVSVIRTPKDAFAAVGRSRTKWIVVLVVSAIYLVGTPFALYWYVRVARRVHEGPSAAELSQRLT